MFDHGETPDGRPYITLELLPRGTDLLSRVTKNGSFSEAEGLPIMWQLTDVLRTAHTRDIAYRDMKLEHVFWSDGRMTLIDWNVSRQWLAEAADDAVLFEWEKERSFQSDLFKLGTIFYSMMTGLDIRDRRVPTPVYSKLEERGFALTDEGIVWPIDFAGAAISAEMEEIICRLVHIDLDQRYQTMAELHEVLENHAQRLGVELVRPVNGSDKRSATKAERSDPLPGNPAHPIMGWLTRLFHVGDGAS
jgi:serine/threonine protein kinase